MIRGEAQFSSFLMFEDHDKSWVTNISSFSMFEGQLLIDNQQKVWESKLMFKFI